MGHSASADSRIGATVAGYRVEALVGRGGMGVVYRAFDPRLKRPVALKLLAPELAEDEAFRERFLRESELAASLDHPNAVPIYEAGEADGHLYIAMRFVEGWDLGRLLEEEGRLEPARALAIVAQVGSALDAAHARGLVHRDVKPGNVLLAGDHVYLSDFGLSKDVMVREGPSESGQLLGTIDYVAPEQIDGEELDGRADVYSLACVLVRCLTGEVPFPRTRRLAVLFAHVQDPAPGVHERRPELPAGLDRVVARGMAKEPDERYPTCRSLVADAAAELGLPGEAWAGPAAARRSRSRTLAGAVVLLSAAAAAIVAVLLAVGGDGVPGPAPTSQGGPAAAPVDPGPAAAPRDLPEPIRLEPGSVGLVDPSTGRIIAGIELPSRPGDIAVDGDSVWIASPDPDNVLRLDRESRAVVDAIPVGVDPVGVAVGEGSVWVVQAGGPSLLRISPETGTVVQTIEIGAGPVDVTVAHGAVWTANRLDDTVQRFDPATGDTATIPVGDAPAAIAASGDAVWVACAGAGAVYRIDPATNTVIATTAVGNGPSSIAVAGEDVWVGNGLDRTVSVVDAAGSTVSSTIPIDDAPAAIAADSGDVWVAGDETGTLVRLDPVDRSVGRTVRLGNAPQGLALAGGELWVGVRGAATSHVGGTLRLVADGMLQSVDPGVTDDWWAWAILSATNDGLVDYRRVGGSGGAVLVPNLAVNLPSPTDGGTTYRFQLRSGIRYSTGEPVRAGDVRRALERAISLAGGLTYLFEGIRGAGTCTRAACDLSAGVVADDEAGTITFHLTEPDPEFLHKLTMTPAYPVPEGVAGPGSVPATGPYAIEEFVPGQAGGRLTLVRNPHFRPWSLAAQPEGNPDRIELTVAPTEDAAIAAVMDGRADLLATSSPPRDRLLELATTHAGQLHVSSLGNVWFMTLNTRVPPFDDVRVRRALNYAIDRSAIVEFFGGPAFAKPTCQILPPSLSGYEPHCPYTASPAAAAGGAWSAPDLEKARALVRASGTAGAPVRVWTTDQFPAGVAVGREVVSALEQLGYRARLRIVRHDPSNYFGQILDSRTEAQVALSGWITQYLSPFEFIASQLTCRAFIPASPENGNVSGFCDPAVDAAIERGAELELSNPELAADQWAAVDRMIVDQAPYAPLVNEVWLDLTSSRVGNYQFHPHWGPLLDQLWVR